LSFVYYTLYSVADPEFECGGDIQKFIKCKSKIYNKIRTGIIAFLLIEVKKNICDFKNFHLMIIKYIFVILVINVIFND